MHATAPCRMVLIFASVAAMSCTVWTSPSSAQRQFASPQLGRESLRPAAKLAEEFFEDVRDGNYLQAYSKLDTTVVSKFSRSRATKLLSSYRTSIAGFSIDQKFTFPTAENPPRVLSCVEAKQGMRRKLYLSAVLVKRSDLGPWKVQQFKM